MALTIYDEDNSNHDEDRWITPGKAGDSYYLVAVHTIKSTSQKNMTIRLISARKATKHEIRSYEQG
jgi:uncharacterized DUF497 family protein